MANANNTKISTLFTWRFMALNADSSKMMYVTAKFEQDARQMLPLGMIAIFMARFPAVEVAS